MPSRMPRSERRGSRGGAPVVGKGPQCAIQDVRAEYRQKKMFRGTPEASALWGCLASSLLFSPIRASRSLARDDHDSTCLECRAAELRFDLAAAVGICVFRLHVRLHVSERPAR